MTKLNPSLSDIRKSCGDIFPNNDKCYYFISKDKNIIKSEENFSVSDVCEELKNEKGKKKYRIYLETILFNEGKK